MAEFTWDVGTKPKKFIKEDATELIGNTPILKMSRLAENQGCKGNILAKLEYFNPLGSVKDRVGNALVNAAFERGDINSDSTLIVPTSGNTGIGLSFSAKLKGLKIIITMPENMSKERVDMLKALGAEVVLTPAETGMQGAIDKANELKTQIENSYIPDQFNDIANANIHKVTTAVEILHDTYGLVDGFVSAVGTGGTFEGCSETLKAYNRAIKCFAVEPETSPVLRGGAPGKHGIQGIGANFYPPLVKAGMIDEVVGITTEEAYATVRLVADTEGLLLGISSGAAVAAAVRIAQREEFRNKNIVVVCPDNIDKYMSVGIFD